MIKLHYCGEDSELPNPYRPVISFVRERIKGEVSAQAVPSLHTGSYNPEIKEAGLPQGVWVNVISGATIDPVAWLDITQLQSCINAEFLKNLEARLTFEFKETK